VSPPRWILRETVPALQLHALSLFRGLEGIRHETPLDSAIQRSINLHFYDQNASLADLAAAYGFGRIKNHPFFDGNKRIALPAATVVMEVNGLRFTGGEANAVLPPSSELDEAGFAAWLAANSSPAF